MRLAVELLEDRLTPVYLPGTVILPVEVPRIAVGAGVGGGEVRVFDPSSGAEALRLNPFGPGYAGGVNVATADLNGDTVPDIVAATASGGSRVKVFDGQTGAELRSFDAFDGPTPGGVNVAVGRVGVGGGWAVVVGAGVGGGPHVKVYDFASGTWERSFFAFAPGFRGGVRVAAGDVNADGAADLIVAAGPGGGPHVEVFDAATGALTRSFFAFAPSFAGGVNVAVTSLHGPANVVASSDAPGTPVRLFNPDGTGTDVFTPFPGTGTRVAVADFRGEGLDTFVPPVYVVGAGPGGGPHVRAAQGVFPPPEGWSVFAFDPSFAGGVSVAAASRVYTTGLAPVPPPLMS